MSLGTFTRIRSHHASLVSANMILFSDLDGTLLMYKHETELAGEQVDDPLTPNSSVLRTKVLTRSKELSQCVCAFNSRQKRIMCLPPPFPLVKRTVPSTS